MKPLLAFSLAIAPQILFVAGLAVREEYVRATGVEVRLAVRPYDPMDPFSGRYLGTPLAIERLDLAVVPHDDGLAYAASAWVALAPGPTHWVPTEVRAERPAPPPGGVVLHADVVPGDRHRPLGVLWLRYGIGRFYIPENGRDPTGWGSSGSTRPELLLVVRVTGSGSAAVVDLLVDGVPYAQWNR